jgi:hypothetical protein
MRLGIAEAWRLGAGLIDGRTQMSGCSAGRSRLRSWASRSAASGPLAAAVSTGYVAARPSPP